MAGLMQGKRGLIMGLANDRSLAWGIAQALHAQGAEMAFSYQGEALEKRVRPLANEVGSDFLIECDVSDMTALDVAFRSEEHTSELQSLMRISYAVFCLKKKKIQ